MMNPAKLATYANDFYIDLISDLYSSGEEITTRNDRVKRLICKPASFFRTPLVSVRKTAWKNCLREWQWFMSGSSYLEDLHPKVNSWWLSWVNGMGTVENNYSKQFRHFSPSEGDDYHGFDQVKYLIDGIKNHPNSRRNVITTWHTKDMVDPITPITNCHGTVIQCFVERGDRLHLVTYQRSCDAICGIPHNWLQYWAFLMWLAHRTDKKPYCLTWIGGDVHLYRAHTEIAEEILRHSHMNLPSPQLVYTPTGEEFLADDFSLDGPYEPLIHTTAPMIV